MALEWENMTLREAGVSLIDCDHRTPPAADSGYPYVAIPQLRDGRIDLSTARRITAEHFVEWTRKAMPKTDDVVLSRRCNPGETACVPANTKFALGQNLVLLRADGTRVYPSLLRWLTRSPVWWEQIAKFLNVGAVFDSLRCADVPNFELPIPPLPEQRAIAHILGTLDDKIDLNRRMNETLEAMARALFTSWFEDFEPVRAKAEGRDPGLPEGVAGLFPDSFEDSELGAIPKGWRVKSLGDILELAYGKALKADDRRQGDIPVYGSNGAIGWHDERLVQGPGIVVGRKGNPGVTTWVPADFYPIDTTFFVVSRLKPPHLHFLYHALRVQRLETLGADSAVPGLNRNIANMSHQVIADAPVLSLFERIAGDLTCRVHQTDAESRTLSALRDTLLPKLISGELRITDAERFLERIN